MLVNDTIQSSTCIVTLPTIIRTVLAMCRSLMNISNNEGPKTESCEITSVTDLTYNIIDILLFLTIHNTKIAG